MKNTINLPATVGQRKVRPDAGYAVMDKKGRVSLLHTGATFKALPLPGRNEPCFCGSGKKFKKCCWVKIDGLQTRRMVEATEKFSKK